MAHNQFSLLGTKRFLPFFVTQFLGAFNDNVFKQGLIILLTFSAVQITPIPVEIRASLCQALFILPFFLFSATAGQIADAWDKAQLIRIIKVFEILIVGMASHRHEPVDATIGVSKQLPWRSWKCHVINLLEEK